MCAQHSSHGVPPIDMGDLHPEDLQEEEEEEGEGEQEEGQFYGIDPEDDMEDLPPFEVQPPYTYSRTCSGLFSSTYAARAAKTSSSMQSDAQLVQMYHHLQHASARNGDSSSEGSTGSNDAPAPPSERRGAGTQHSWLQRIRGRGGASSPSRSDRGLRSLIEPRISSSQAEATHQDIGSKSAALTAKLDSAKARFRSERAQSPPRSDERFASDRSA